MTFDCQTQNKRFLRFPAVDVDTNELNLLTLEDGVLRIQNWVYNPNTLAWERMKQPIVEVAGDLTVTMGDVESLLSDHYYKRSKAYTYVSGNIKYLCKNTDVDANETDVDWLIWKLTDTAVPDKEGPRTGAVNTEAAINGLSWNI